MNLYPKSESLYQIIQQLRTTKGNNDKLAILEANKDNVLLREYFKAMLDPAIIYYTTKIGKPSFNKLINKDINPKSEISLGFIGELIRVIAGRVKTGDAAKDHLATMNWSLTPESQELLGYIIKRKIDGANVGDSMVLKTWPDLYFIPPYMRCAGMDDKVKAHYAKCDEFYVQTKRDGSFAYGISSHMEGYKLITRQGSVYPEWFAALVLADIPVGNVLVGELEVYESVINPYIDGDVDVTWKLLDRKTGNGILNSVQHSENEEEFKQYQFKYVAWDMLTEAEFKSGKSERKYKDRLQNLYDTIPLFCNVDTIDSWEVSSMEEAYKIYNEHTASGLEGVVIKTPDGLWRDSSSGTKDAVKLKVVFEAEYEITGYYEGEGKAAGMLGGLSVKSSDGKIVCNVGSGFTDRQRKDIWDDICLGSNPVGKIVTLEANGVISNRNKETLSLSLPVSIEIRTDKTKADSYEEVMAALNTAMQGGKK